jgi:hypothetical protein
MLGSLPASLRFGRRCRWRRRELGQPSLSRSREALTVAQLGVLLDAGQPRRGKACADPIIRLRRLSITEPLCSAAEVEIGEIVRVTGLYHQNREFSPTPRFIQDERRGAIRLPRVEAGKPAIEHWLAGLNPSY